VILIGRRSCIEGRGNKRNIGGTLDSGRKWERRCNSTNKEKPKIDNGYSLNAFLN